MLGLAACPGQRMDGEQTLVPYRDGAAATRFFTLAPMSGPTTSLTVVLVRCDCESETFGIKVIFLRLLTRTLPLLHQVVFQHSDRLAQSLCLRLIFTKFRVSLGSAQSMSTPRTCNRAFRTLVCLSCSCRCRISSMIRLDCRWWEMNTRWSPQEGRTD